MSVLEKMEPGQKYTTTNLSKLTGMPDYSVKSELIAAEYGGYVEKCSMPKSRATFYKLSNRGAHRAS